MPSGRAASLWVPCEGSEEFRPSSDPLRALGEHVPQRGAAMKTLGGVWNSPDNASSALSNRAQEGTAMIVSTKRPLKDTECRIQELELTKDGGLRLETLSTQYAHPITIALDSEELDRIETKLHRAEKGSRVKVEDS